MIKVAQKAIHKVKEDCLDVHNYMDKDSPLSPTNLGLKIEKNPKVEHQKFQPNNIFFCLMFRLIQLWFFF